MQFHLTNKINLENKSNHPGPLIFSEQDWCWFDDNGSRFNVDSQVDFIPLEKDDFIYINGHFVVEIIDGFGTKAYMNIRVVDGFAEYIENALSQCDGIFIGKSLSESGLTKPSLDFSFIADCICYGINSGTVTKNTIECTDEMENEEVYTWQII